MTSRKHTRSRPEIAEACRSFFVGHDLILCHMIPEGIETDVEEVAPDTLGAEHACYGEIALERRLRDALVRLNPNFPLRDAGGRACQAAPPGGFDAGD